MWAGGQYRKNRTSDADIREYLHGRLQQIHVEFSPWFTPGFTYSLFVEFGRDSAGADRAGMRTPDNAFGDWILFPRTNNRFEARLHSAASRHLRKAVKKSLQSEKETIATDEQRTEWRLRKACLEAIDAVLRRDEARIDQIKIGWATSNNTLPS